MRMFDLDGLRQPAVVALCGLLMAGCATDTPMSRDEKGAMIGGAGGAVLGGLLGGRSGHAGRGAVIGGMAGAIAGGAIGHYMDKQGKELEQVAETKRIDDGIIVTMKDQILFDFDSADLRPEPRDSLKKMAGVFKKYDKTKLTVAGHTDNVGSASYNIQLSERRAKAVADYLAGLGVAQARLRIMGFGSERPLASNDSAEGRAQNRRVEIHIAPNEELRKEDQSQKG